MRVRRDIILVLVACLLCCTGGFSTPAGAQGRDQSVVKLLAYDDPPFIQIESQTGEVTGRTVTVVKQIFAAAEVDYRLAIVPIRRALAHVEKEDQSCAFSFVKTPERNEKYSWVGPVHRGGWGIFTRPNAAPAILAAKRKDDFRDKTILMQAGSVMAEELVAQGMNIIPLETAQTGIKALFARRADYVMGGLTSLPTKARLLGLGELKLLHVWKRVDFYLMCSTGLASNTLARLQSAARRLAAKGDLDLH